MIDFIKEYKYTIIACILSCIIGFLVFGFYFDYSVLNPTYTDWIFAANTNDLMQFQIGWHYFRNAPWAFPFGQFNTLSYPIYTSILGTLSVPLIAIPLKLISPILPEYFQYIGFWHLICFVLQACVGTIIVKRYLPDSYLGSITAAIAGFIFISSPLMVIFSFWHSTVVCHFFILIAFIPFIYEKMTLKQTMILYGIIAFLMGMVNAYITVISGYILFVYCCVNYFKNKDFKVFYNLLIFCILTLLSMFLTGAFSMNMQMQDVNLTGDSFNLNGFFNPFGRSKFLPDLDIVVSGTGAGQIIAYAYYGLGVILFIFYTFILFIHDVVKKKVSVDKPLLIAAIISIIFSVVIAVSPMVTFGGNVLFEIPYPDFILNIWNVFRITGRFIWITYYIILIFAFVYFAKRNKIITVLSVFVVVSVIQFADVVIPTKKDCNVTHMIYKNTLSKVKYWKYFWLLNPGIKHVIYDEAIGRDIAYLYVDEIICNIAPYAKNTLFSNFYFARKIIGTNKQSEYMINNFDVGDLFISHDISSVRAIAKRNPGLYYYKYLMFVIVSKEPLVLPFYFSAPQIKKISPNAINYERLFHVGIVDIDNYPLDIKRIYEENNKNNFEKIYGEYDEE